MYLNLNAAPFPSYAHVRIHFSFVLIAWQKLIANASSIASNQISKKNNYLHRRRQAYRVCWLSIVDLYIFELSNLNLWTARETQTIYVFIYIITWIYDFGLIHNKKNKNINVWAPSTSKMLTVWVNRKRKSSPFGFYRFVWKCHGQTTEFFITLSILKLLSTYQFCWCQLMRLSQ